MSKAQELTRGHSNAGAFRLRSTPLLVAACLILAVPLASKTKSKSTQAESSEVELSATLADTLKAVGEVAADPIVYERTSTSATGP